MFKKSANVSSEIYKFSQLQPIIEFVSKLRGANKGEFPDKERQLLETLECNLLQLAISITQKRVKAVGADCLSINCGSINAKETRKDTNDCNQAG